MIHPKQIVFQKIVLQINQWIKLQNLKQITIIIMVTVIVTETVIVMIIIMGKIVTVIAEVMKKII